MEVRLRYSRKYNANLIEQEDSGGIEREKAKKSPTEGLGLRIKD
jgi:hypothetical protein